MSGTELETFFREHNEALLHPLIARPGLVDDAKEAAREAYPRLFRLTTLVVGRSLHPRR